MSEHFPISRSLAALVLRDVSEADRARTRLHLLDWVACMVAGMAEPGCAEVRQLAALEGAGRCSVIGGSPLGPQAACLANGPPGAVLEMDDVDKRALLHPGPVVIPATLAVAQQLGIDDGNRILDAIVAGYEAMIRVGRAAGEHFLIFHATATCGTFGAAAAGARLMGLSEEATAWAIGNAGQQAAGLWQVRREDVYTKAFHCGRAAANGVAAAFLAQQGYRGPLHIFEGTEGFFKAMCPGGDPQRILGRADRWMIHDVGFKPHAACRHAHAAIDCALDLRPRLGGEAPAAIRIHTYGAAVDFCPHRDPATTAQAKFSLAHAVAVALVHGDAALARFTPEAIADPHVGNLRVIAESFTEARFDQAFPAHFGARVEIETQSGRTIEACVDDALGDPENPMSREGLDGKARDLMAWGGMDDAAISTILDHVAGLGKGNGLGAIIKALPGSAT